MVGGEKIRDKNKQDYLETIREKIALKNNEETHSYDSYMNDSFEMLENQPKSYSRPIKIQKPMIKSNISNNY